MSQLIDQLLKDIDTMIGHHRQLVELAEKQRQALINGDAETLQKLLPKFESVTGLVMQTEQHRIEITSALAKSLGMNVKDVTVTQLIGKLDGESSCRLHSLSEQLKETVAELAAANERNAMLTKFSADYTKKILEMVVGVGRNDSYGPSKKPHQEQPRILNLQA